MSLSDLMGSRTRAAGFSKVERCFNFYSLSCMALRVSSFFF
jgi:hypothetical protein